MKYETSATNSAMHGLNSTRANNNPNESSGSGRRIGARAALAAICGMAILSGCCTAPTSKGTAASIANDSVPLDAAIDQVNAAIKEYQDNRGSGASALPKLTSATFDFKTVTATTASGQISFLIFKLGTSHETDVTNDVTYTFTAPALGPRIQGAEEDIKPPTLKDELAKSIQAAAFAIKNHKPIQDLNFTKLAINVQYGVKVDATGTAGPTISLVTLGVTGDKNTNTVQSVTLTYGS